MKILIGFLITLASITLLFGILQTLAAERVEVIELHTRDEAGAIQTTRLWVVDDEGLPYLRGQEGSGWVTRLMANEQLQLTRGDDTATYSWQLRDDKIVTINTLMKEKYTWGDTFFEMALGGRETSLMFELTVED